MKYIEKNITQIINEHYLVETLNLNNKCILELGCGEAVMTQNIASFGFNRKIIACEVDKIQHEKNQKLKIENIEFKLCSAQDIDLQDNSIDIVFMFKSFHHIPITFMSQALKEIYRVLKPNGLAYISEPLYYGDLNDIISMFHDEKEVRKEAFENIKKSVESNQFKLFKEIFFNSEVQYKDFNDFKNRVINVTYNKNCISDDLEKKIKEKFNSYLENDNNTFMKPFRVDILQKII